MSTVNIHEYPQDPEDLPHYRAAVMLAAANGAAVEESSPWLHTINEWESRSNPVWNWYEVRYRIAAPKIAEGHNPNKLTEDQVGVKDGWRLLSAEENKALLDEDEGTDGLEYFTDGLEYFACDGEWSYRCAGGCVEYTYRTKKPKGYFLPKSEVPLAELDKQACSKSLRAFAEGESMAAYTFKCGWMEALKYERSRAK